MMQQPYFSVETVDGYQLGRLTVPLTQVADWLNFLAAPQYRASLVSAEQSADVMDLYFQASDGVYLYLEVRLNCSELAIAG
ncbi:MAG: hypothetical protein WBA57_01435 [Elainellaceae cyanobacterium]